MRAKLIEQLELVPLDQETAFAFIRQHHRHHLPPPGDILRVGVMLGGRLVGVATWGRPVARHLNDGFTVELTRLATDGTPNACSKLYGAVARMAFAAGYRRIVTYVLASETGASARAAGWRIVGEIRGGSWSRPSRPRIDKHPLQGKLCLELTAPGLTERGNRAWEGSA